MNICNRCGSPVDRPRYSLAASTICPDCEDELTLGEREHGPVPADEELGQVNQALRDDLWREAHEARAELRAQMAGYRAPAVRPDQRAFSFRVVLVLMILAGAGLALGASVAFWEHVYRVDGIRSEGMPVSCWHFRGK